VTVHDGFTLRDLVSYNEKHNEANGEDSRDGESHNRSWNCGVEGETDDPSVLALRARQQRNFLTTLFMSRGVPLLLGGDEMGRTQQGNNNAYCQDDEISWYDWREERRTDPLIAFTADLIRLRQSLPVLRSTHWPVGEGDRPDAVWFSIWGIPMTQDEWDHPASRCLSVVFDGSADNAAEPGPSVLLMFNAAPESHTFTVPKESQWGEAWTVRVNTDGEDQKLTPSTVCAPGDEVEIQAHAMLVLTQDRPS
jgi:isoamylase